VVSDEFFALVNNPAERGHIFPSVSLRFIPQSVATRERAGAVALMWLLLLVVLGLTVLPLIMILLSSFEATGEGLKTSWSLRPWVEAWSNPKIVAAVGATLRIAVTRLVIALSVAVLISWLLARTNIPGSRWLEFGFWISHFMPTIAVVQGWIFLLEGKVGLVNQWLGRLPFAATVDLFSFWGIVWVHLMAQNITVLVILLTLALRNMDAALEEASLLSGASQAGTAARITLPLMMPTITTLGLMGFVRALESFEVERVLGPPIGLDIYSTLIVSMIRDDPPNVPAATALASTVLLFMLPLVLLQRWYSGRHEHTTVSGRMRRGVIDLGHWRWPVFALVLVLVCLLTVVPALSVIAGSFMTRWGAFHLSHAWTVGHWAAVYGEFSFWSSFRNTMMIGLGAAFLAVALLFLAAYVIVKTKFKGRRLLDLVSWLPWSFPGILLGFGLLSLVLRVPLFRPLYGSVALLIFAIVAVNMTVGTQLLKNGLMQLSGELEEGSRAAGASWGVTQLRIVLPLLAPMLVTVGLVVFISAVRDVSTVLLLAAPGTRTLALLSLDYIVTGRLEEAAVVTSLVIALAVGTALIARSLGSRMGLDRRY